MVEKYFFLYRDGQRIKELSQEEFRKYLRLGMAVVYLNDYGLSLHVRNAVQWVGLPQIEQMLKLLKSQQ